MQKEFTSPFLWLRGLSMKNNLSNLTLSQAVKLIKEREITSYELVNACIERIKSLDGKINAFVTLNKNALLQAKKLDKQKKVKGTLHGIPFAVKDNFLTLGLRTTASSKVLDNYIPQYNATVVQRLIDSGAIILGKTNMDAWAHGSSTETSDYGVTKNPWDFERIPGGSSGGSAAAVSADMCISSIGSETAGSIRGPAAWCGVVGLKPTYGRVSRYGVIAMGSSLDCPGPITKTVEDAAVILEVLAGNDPFDATTSSHPVDSYTQVLKKDIKGVKVAIAKDYLLPAMSEKAKDLILRAAKVLEDLGAKLDYVKTLDPKYAVADYTVIQRSEVSSNLARFDGIRYGNGRAFFGEEAKKRIILGTFVLSEGYAEKFYKKAQKVRTLFIKDFNKIFSKFDLIIGPTMPGPAPKIGITKGKAMYGEMADILLEPSAMAGLPAISVPCGFVKGLPVGLDIIGPQFSEARILQVAFAYENQTKWYKRRERLWKFLKTA